MLFITLATCAVLLHKCYAYISYERSPEGKAAIAKEKAAIAEQKRLDKEAYQRRLVKVKNEEVTDADGQKYRRITYSTGSVLIPIEYIGVQRSRENYVVQFMHFFMPSKSPVPLSRDEKKVGFHFFFDVHHGRWLNTQNTAKTYKKLIADGEIVPRSHLNTPGLTVYQRPGKYKGKIYFIDKDLAQDPFGNQTAFVCAPSGSCHFSWRLNDNLFFFAEFKDSEIDNIIEVVQTLSELVTTFTEK